MSDVSTPTRHRVTLELLRSAGRKGGPSSGGDPFWLSRYFYRRITVYFTWAFAKLGIGSKAATLISGFVLFAGAACYAMPRPGYWVAFGGRFTSTSEAEAAATRYRGQGFPDAYPREIRP